MSGHEALLALAHETVREAEAAGADEAEAYVSESTVTTISAIGPFCTPRSISSVGVGVRVIVDGRAGFAGRSGADAPAKAIAQAVGSARRVARPERAPLLPKPRPIDRPATTIDPGIAEPDPERLEQVVLEAREALTAPGHVAYATLALTSRSSVFAVVNSHGVETWDRRGRETFTMEARVEKGAAAQTALEVITSRRPLTAGRDVTPAVQGAADRALQGTSGGTLSRTMDTVVLAPGPAAQLVRQFANAFNARHAQAGRSALSGRLGEPVTAPSFTLTDEPWKADEDQVARVDHEGMPTAPLTLVDRGRLTSFLYDAAAAAAEPREPTGHGLRTTGLNGGIQIAPHRLRVAAGDRGADEVLGAADEAVLISDPITGAFTTDTATGSFSLVAPFAFLVRKGRIEHALGPTTLGGDLYAMLRGIRAVGSDVAERIEGHVPSLCLEGVSCAT